MNTNNLSITESFNSATQIVLYDDGASTTYNKGDSKYEKLLNALEEICKGAHDMPAFGVSIDHLTREEMKSGFWLELVFEDTKEFEGMPFDALLINVQKDFSGFNLIRKFNGKYDGRCFYLNLSKNMEPLYNAIIQASKNKD